MIAPLQLLDYRTTMLAYERLDAKSPPDDVDLGVALEFEIDATYEDEKDVQRLALTIGYNQTQIPDEVAPYIAHRGQVRVTGSLRWIDDEVASRDDARDLMLTNGLTMLYGIARVRVADLTEGGERERLLLPSIAFQPIVKDWLQDDENSTGGASEALAE